MAQENWPPGEDFADRLARLRRHRGADNTAIAEATGVSVKTVSHWIGGQRPDTAALLKLARYFEVEPEWLLEGAPRPKRAPAHRKRPAKDRGTSQNRRKGA